MAKQKKYSSEFARDIANGLREIRECLEAGVPLEERFLVRKVEIPEPGRYDPKAVRALREKLGVSQAIFARMLGVSKVLAESWEQGKRQPSPLARRLLDTVRADPAAWVATVQRVTELGKRKAG
jgi:putative transcriptional regulator